MHYNDVTGNALVTRPASNQYRTGWDAIFGKKEAVEPSNTAEKVPNATTLAAMAEADSMISGRFATVAALMADLETPSTNKLTDATPEEEEAWAALTKSKGTTPGK